jgi:hypothetical protein
MLKFSGWFSVKFFLGQTVLGAGIYTDAAIHAYKWRAFPSRGFFVHLDALGRAFDRADSAEIAGLTVV